MPEIILSANRSLTVSTVDLNGNMNTDTLYVGRNGDGAYRSYMYFDTSLVPSGMSVISAKLILSTINECYPSVCKYLYVYPLASEFNSSTTYLHYPKFRGPYDKQMLRGGAVELDVTAATAAWFNGTGVNYGLMIKGTEHTCSLMTFGSAINPDPAMVPKLKVVYDTEPVPSQSLITFKEKTFTLSDAATTSASINTSTMAMGTFYITRTDNGVNPLTFKIQTSANGIDWVDDSSKSMTTGSIAIAPLQYGKYYRLVGTGNPTWSVNVKFVYQCY